MSTSCEFLAEPRGMHTGSGLERTGRPFSASRKVAESNMRLTTHR
jgi:hypothetical protein